MKASLSFVCHSGIQEDIRRFISNCLSDCAISESDQVQIVLAVDEAISNAIVHGNKNDFTKSMALELEISETRMVVDISNIGGFEETRQAQANKEKQLDELIREKRKGGLGLKLIYAIMDLVCFYETRDGNAACMLVKMFDRAPGKPINEDASQYLQGKTTEGHLRQSSLPE